MGGLSSGAIAGIVVGVVAFIIFKSLCMYSTIRAWLSRVTEHDLKASRRTRSTATATATATMKRSINVSNVRSFSYEEMEQATDGFSPMKLVGQGGYGKVYSGVLADGQKVAVKRAEDGSHQGSLEFETEILLLSRVHHRNLVSLIGYCLTDEEQMLVYEFIANGSLQFHMSLSAVVPLNFMTRLQIALGSARGIFYLHSQADPPIYHRDVKASNILLDDKFDAKVADFGLSKLVPQPSLEGTMPSHISTVVKGTPGYLDPEYFKTHRLTDKSDVYSFGVLTLVLFTGLQPISEGRNIVREVNIFLLENDIASIVDSRITGKYPPGPMESLFNLALRCCRDAPSERPTMAEVVAHLEQLWKKTYSDITSCRNEKEYIAFSAEFLGNMSEDSFIEINPSLSSSPVSSSVWTDSKGTGTKDGMSDVRVDVYPR